MTREPRTSVPFGYRKLLVECISKRIRIFANPGGNMSAASVDRRPVSLFPALSEVFADRDIRGIHQVNGCVLR